ncbi:rCG30132 [Rattus norvegicus]|uniref:RCG30132 n=1 Tax=Rattus norvegicus TaxID=10116 RepID=A6IMU1_RAT|nr:rCG30132 [Rattus norvegicus]
MFCCVGLASPMSYIGLDLLGPFTCQGLGLRNVLSFPTVRPYLDLGCLFSDPISLLPLVPLSSKSRCSSFSYPLEERGYIRKGVDSMSLCNSSWRGQLRRGARRRCPYKAPTKTHLCHCSDGDPQ